MAALRPPDEELHTWPEIATYLGISVREAQNREKSEGVPVHRLPGKKPRVWALRAELDTWKRQVTLAGSGLVNVRTARENFVASGAMTTELGAGSRARKPDQEAAGVTESSSNKGSIVP